MAGSIEKWRRIFEIAYQLGAAIPLVAWGYIVQFYRRRAGHRPLWLFAERQDEARDNGYHLYRYTREHRPSVEAWYIINPESADAGKIRELGNAVMFGSMKHRYLYASCDAEICTHQRGVTPYGSGAGVISRLVPRRIRVFLQHGITKDHYAHLQHVLRPRRAGQIIICGAAPEYRYLRKFAQQGKATVVYTGFPRYDRLMNRTMNHHPKFVLVMPTWRTWMSDYRAGGRSQLPLSAQRSFVASEYYKNYQELLTSRRLHAWLEKEEMKLVFFPHYMTRPYMDTFDKPQGGRVVLATPEQYDVQQLLRDASLLVTDYSSVFFDFAYMEKPVIFFQFDQLEYREDHYREGWFDYYKNGFGPIVSKADAVIDAVFQYGSRGYRMEEHYLQRMQETFSFRDSNNCQRTFDAIVNCSRCSG